MNKGNELMAIQQLPIIVERLHEIKKEIETRTSEVMKLVCNEDSMASIKKTRADLNKEFADYEAKRKSIKNAIMDPYMQFETVYKECILEPFKKADEDMKTKINAVETTLKTNKEDEFKRYFEELKKAESLEFVTYQDVGLNVTLSASVKSLKDKCTEFIDKVKADLQLIESQENSEEIMLEYKSSFNVSQAMLAVKSRHEEIERYKKLQEERKAKEEQQKAEADKLNEIAAELSAPIELSPPVEPEKTYTTSFKVTGTLSQLKELKEFLNNGGYKYEC